MGGFLCGLLLLFWVGVVLSVFVLICVLVCFRIGITLSVVLRMVSTWVLVQLPIF